MIWIGIILASIGVLISIATTDCDPYVIVGIFLIAVGTIIFVNYNYPTAMDVYQGKTTLKVSYKDGIPVDSVVVFKNIE